MKSDKPFSKAFVCSVALWGLITLGLFAFGVEDASRVSMGVLGSCVWPFLIAGCMGYWSKKFWSWTDTGITVAITCLVGVIILLQAGKGNSERNPISASPQAIPAAVRESLERTARQINSQAPMRVDKYTVLNSASFSGRAVIYRNTLEVELSDEEFRDLLRDIRPLTVENFRRNPSDAKAFAKYGIIAIYQYTEKSGKAMNLELDFAKDSDLAWARH